MAQKIQFFVGFHISGLLQNRGVASTSYVLRVRVTSPENLLKLPTARKREVQTPGPRFGRTHSYTVRDVDHSDTRLQQMGRGRFRDTARKKPITVLVITLMLVAGLSGHVIRAETLWVSL